MKHELKRNNDPTTKYPILKEYKDDNGNNFVVYFISPKEGLVVWASRGAVVGTYLSDGWREDEFSPLKGSIELSND